MQVTAIDALLAPLDDAQRSQLVAAMGRIHRVLDGPPRPAAPVIRVARAG